jgi:hypothetical protein
LTEDQRYRLLERQFQTAMTGLRFHLVGMSANWLTQIRQQALDPLRHAAMALGFCGPCTLARVFGESKFQRMPLSQSRCIGGCGHEFGAGQIKVALTGTF